MSPTAAWVTSIAISPGPGVGSGRSTTASTVGSPNLAACTAFMRILSIEDKTQRSEDLLAAAESLAVELGGVRFITLAPVTERAGLHRTGVRR